MKIYVITKGCYSDYHICAVTTNRKKANKLSKIMSDRYDDAEIETYESDEYVDLIDRGFCAYLVDFVDGIYTISHVSKVDDHESIEYIAWNRITPRMNKKEYYVYVRAKDEEHAKKIAQDLMAEYKYRKLVEGEDLP